MSLKEVYQPYFKIGAAVGENAFGRPAALYHLRQEYDSITCENDMKPEKLLDEKRDRRDPGKYDRDPAVNPEAAKKYLEYAKENGMRMRGHTLVWHNQTPRWFFARGYEMGENAPLADRATMLARLDGYIRSVMTFVQEEYPGIIYAWDVVNEAVEDGGIRPSLWTQTVGEDYILQAFRIARKICGAFSQPFL